MMPKPDNVPARFVNSARAGQLLGRSRQSIEQRAERGSIPAEWVERGDGGHSPIVSRETVERELAARAAPSEKRGEATPPEGG